MNFNKAIVLMTCLIVPTLILSSAAHARRELIRDRSFVGGIQFQGTESSNVILKRTPVLAQVPQSHQYAWSMCEWNMPRRLGTTPVVLDNQEGTTFKWGNPFAQLRIGLGDDSFDERGVTLAVNATNAWGGEFRKGDERWPHLLLKQDISPSTGGSTPIGQLSQLNFMIKVRLNQLRYEDEGDYDPKKHTVQFPMFFRLRSMVNKRDMMWLAVPVFDARHEQMTGKGISYTKFGENVMYNEGYVTPSKKSIATHEGRWTKVQVDLVPLIKRALAAAKKANLYQSYDLNDYRITYFNMGYETPGMGVASIQVKDVSLIEIPK